MFDVDSLNLTQKNTKNTLTSVNDDSTCLNFFALISDDLNEVRTVGTWHITASKYATDGVRPLGVSQIHSTVHGNFLIEASEELVSSSPATTCYSTQYKKPLL